MKLTVWGAAQQVTGSMHLLEVNNYKILIDCGLDYENDVNLLENVNFPFSPSEIDLVVLTHAHIDHSGNLPTLVRLGFEGQILCTPPTADLTQLLLADSVNIFLGKLKKKPFKKRSKKYHHDNQQQQPLYLQKHVMDTTDRMVTIGFNKPFQIREDIEIQFIPTGHLLGAAAVHFKVTEAGQTKTIAFTGDIGRKNYPVLINPETLPETDFLVTESTYGGRLHTAIESIEETLIKVIKETCINQPGRLIIPAFSVGRTQSLVYTLNKIFSKNLLPPVPIFVDSPMAIMATDIYRKHQRYVNDDAKSFYQKNGDEFEFANLSYVKELKESKEISNHFEPCIIISSAGMLEGGRIQDHLFYNIQNFYATILFIGYCAKNTLGYRLLRGDAVVRLRGRDLSVFATIKKTDQLSGHADHKGIMEYIKAIPKEGLKKIFLVHGEQESMLALQSALKDDGYKAVIPEKGMIFEL
ncbi:ribonuclease [Pedobacter glucosidilyticus]|nr:MBL fold metallo-hydrolase [Pedobacter glucosidilyticus]KHJ38383.1 ribonuclease [Pedobacter glucosidilyticus]